MRIWVKGLLSRKHTSRTSSQHKEDLFVPEVQKAGNNKQRQEIENKGKEKGTRGKGERYLSWRIRDCLRIERAQTHGHMTTYKVGNPIVVKHNKTKK